MGDDIFRNIGLLAGLLVYVVVLMPFLLLGLAIPYAVLHSRDSRGVERDPQLGLKTALYFFYSLSVLVILTGLTIIAVDMVRDQQGFIGGPPMRGPRSGDWFNAAKRTGAAFMFAGFVFGFVQFVLIQTATNNRRWPLVRRVFGGWRLAVAGLVVLITFIGLVVALFQENMQFESLKNYLATLSVWTPAALVDLVLLRYRSRRYSQDDDQVRERALRREPPE